MSSIINRKNLYSNLGNSKNRSNSAFENNCELFIVMFLVLSSDSNWNRF